MPRLVDVIIDSVPQLSEAVKDAKKNSPPFWARDVIPGLFRVFSLTSGMEPNISGCRAIAMRHEILFTTHSEMLAGFAQERIEMHSPLFLGQTPKAFLDSADLALREGLVSKKERAIIKDHEARADKGNNSWNVDVLADDYSRVLRVLVARYAVEPEYMRSSSLPSIFETIRPGVEILLEQGYRGADLCGDNLALMYCGQVR